MSTLHLRLTSDNADYALSQKIRPNRLILSSYAVRLPANHGLTAVNIDIPWLFSGVKAGLSYRLTLPVSDGISTISNPALEMSSVENEVPQFFHVNVYKNTDMTFMSSGTALAFTIDLMFTYLE